MATKDRPDVFMPLFIGDYLAGTSRLSTEQHGAYLLLIMDYWMNGPPPNDDRVLASITRMSMDAWSIAQASIKHFFYEENGCLKHKRIEQELARATENKAKAKEKAEKAAKARWKNATSNAPSIPQEVLEECPLTSTSSSTNKNNTNSGELVTPQAKKPPRATRLPESWTLDDKFRSAALEINPQLDLQALTHMAAKFRDYWIAKPGKDATKNDWLATWRNWVRNDTQRIHQPRSPPQQFLNSREKNAQRNAEIFDYNRATDF